jgi:hypothetical protein
MILYIGIRWEEKTMSDSLSHTLIGDMDEASWRELGTVFSVNCCVQITCQQVPKSARFKEVSHWIWLFLLLAGGGGGVCVCVCLCVSVCMWRVVQLQEYHITVIWALLCIWTFISTYILISDHSHIVSLLLNWWGWGKLVLQMATFHCFIAVSVLLWLLIVLYLTPCFIPGFCY